MNRKTLDAVLRRFGVDPRCYDLEGRAGDDAVVMSHETDGWHVYFARAWPSSRQRRCTHRRLRPPTTSWIVSLADPTTHRGENGEPIPLDTLSIWFRAGDLARYARSPGCNLAAWLPETSPAQRETCERNSVEADVPLPDAKLGLGPMDGTPVNGLRHPPPPGTSGWFIWAGGEIEQSDDSFFAPIPPWLIWSADFQTWCAFLHCRRAGDSRSRQVTRTCGTTGACSTPGDSPDVLPLLSAIPLPSSRAKESVDEGRAQVPDYRPEDGICDRVG